MADAGNNFSFPFANFSDCGDQVGSWQMQGITFPFHLLTFLIDVQLYQD